MKKKSYIVFGCGKFGSKVAEELVKCGAEVMAVDKNRDNVSEVADKVTDALVMDVSDENEASTLGLESYDGAIITMTDDLAACVTAVALCKESGIPLIVAKVGSERHGNILKMLGATKIIIPEHDSAIKTARMLQTNRIFDIMELSDEIVIAEITARQKWIGKSLIELKLPTKRNVNIVALRKDGKLSTDIDPASPVSGDESLVIITDKKSLSKIMSEE